MNEVILLMLVFLKSTGELVSVTGFDIAHRDMAACQARADVMLTVQLPAHWYARAVCVNAGTPAVTIK